MQQFQNIFMKNLEFNCRRLSWDTVSQDNTGPFDFDIEGGELTVYLYSNNLFDS